MGTKLTDEGEWTVVETNVGYFGKPKRPEGAVRVGKGKTDEIRAEAIKQALAIREKLRLRVVVEEPVV